jgi:DNA-binding transcriptional MerR regulator
MKTSPAIWTLDELGAKVALALSVDYAGQSSGRVREVPDRRTIRYYTTLGLIDPPAAMRGRTALYGVKHLTQLVAIKRLQAKGLTLAEIQERLLGITDHALRQLARLPSGVGLLTHDDDDANNEDDPERRERPFWKEVPAPQPTTPVNREETSSPLHTLSAVELVHGATLLLDAARPLDADDLSALRIVAEPLVKWLRARRILGAQPDHSPHQE